MDKDFSKMTIGERILFLFSKTPIKTQGEIGQLLGVSQDTISKWKKGRIPSMKQIEQILDETLVDFNWLINGKTNNVNAITYAFFPDNYRPNEILHHDSYCFARRLCGYAIANINEEQIHFPAIQAASALYRHATTPDAPNPIEVANKDELVIFHDLFSDTPIYLDEIIALAKINIPEDFYYNFTNLIDAMISCYEKDGNYTVKQPPTVHAAGESPSTISIQVSGDTEYSNILNFKKRIQPTKLPEIAPEDFREIPFYPDEIAAGQPLNIRDNPEGIVVIHKDWCKNQQNMVAVRVSSTGTSMEPTIPAGAIVTIDTTPIDPKLLINKPVAIYKNNDGATIKRLRKTARGWCGVPDNRDPEHEIIIIEDGDRIIGKVNSVHYAL